MREDVANENKPLAASGGVKPVSPSSSSSSSPLPSADRLERCGRWLSSIPRDDVAVLAQTEEYQDFLKAFQRLGTAHRRVISSSPSPPTVTTDVATESDTSFSSTDTEEELMDGQVAGDLSGCEATATPRKKKSPSRTTKDSPIEVTAHHSSSTTTTTTTATAAVAHNQRKKNLLQQFVRADDVLLRVLEFLECRSLIQTSKACSRFKQLAEQSAAQRTLQVAETRQLSHVMQLLRAQEQMEGVEWLANRERLNNDGSNNNNDDDDNEETVAIEPRPVRRDCHVRVPMLLLGRQVLVTGAGDEEFNGVYHCTDCNANGFVFTKPRFPIQRVRSRQSQQQQQRHGGDRTNYQDRPAANPHNVDEDDANDAAEAPMAVLPANNNGVPRQQPEDADVAEASHAVNEATQREKPLQCYISKRYSERELLWYMSKEVVVRNTPTEENIVPGAVEGGGADEPAVSAGNTTIRIQQVYSYWARLPWDVPAEIFKFPSTTSFLARHETSWHVLSTNQSPDRSTPTLELLD